MWRKRGCVLKIHMKLTKVRKETAQIKTLAEEKQVIHIPWKREWDGAKKTTNNRRFCMCIITTKQRKDKTHSAINLHFKNIPHYVRLINSFAKQTNTVVVLFVFAFIYSPIVLHILSRLSTKIEPFFAQIKLISSKFIQNLIRKDFWKSMLLFAKKFLARNISQLDTV